MTDVNYENIERYLSGNMTEKEREHFEAELDENEELAQELHFYEYVNHSISECLYQRGTHELGSFNRTRSQKQSDMSAIKWVILGIIAVLFSGVLIWSPWQKSRLADMSDIKMSSTHTGTPVSSKYTDIIQLFNQNKYEEVLPLLNSALAEQPNDLYIRYYRGLTFLNLKYLGSARRDLLKVYTENDPKMYEAAYFIAVSYTQEEDDYKVDAIKWLDKIPQTSPVYAQATALKSKL